MSDQFMNDDEYDQLMKDGLERYKKRMNNIKEAKLDFEDMELLQLEFYVSEMEKNCSMGGEIRRHESIYNKIKKEQSRRILVKLEEEEHSQEFFDKYFYVAKELGEGAKAEDILKIMESLAGVVMKKRSETKVGPFGFNKKPPEENNDSD